METLKRSAFTKGVSHVSVGVYLRGEVLFIEPVDVLVSGIQRSSEPVATLPALATDEHLGSRAPSPLLPEPPPRFATAADLGFGGRL